MPRIILREGKRLDRAGAKEIVKSIRNSAYARQLEKKYAHPKLGYSVDKAHETANIKYYAHLDKRVASLAAFKAVEPLKYLGKEKQLELRSLLARTIFLSNKIKHEVFEKNLEKPADEIKRLATEKVMKDPEADEARRKLLEFVENNRIPNYITIALRNRVLELLAEFREAGAESGNSH